MKAKEVIEAARDDVARMMHVNSKEANHWVIYSAMEHFKAIYGREGKPHIVTSSIEHPSILEPLRSLSHKGELDGLFVFFSEHTEIGVDPSTGIVKLDDLEDALCERTVLVSVMLANNETGVIQPLAQIADIARSGFFRAELKRSLLLEKYLYEKTVPLQSLFRGGSQEHGKRAGTENTPMIAGLGAACRIVTERLPDFVEHMRDVRDYFEEQLKNALGDAVVIHFATSQRIPNTSSVSFVKYPGNASDLLSKISAVLSACGILDKVAFRTVRFSFGRESSRVQVDRVVNELKSIAFFGKYGSSLLSAINKGPLPGF
uniref:Selenocysteine lyase n=1 Tax=Parascaris equorum TaxID=6256 RepID=A0A914RN38_PAREQ